MNDSIVEENLDLENSWILQKKTGQTYIQLLTYKYTFYDILIKFYLRVTFLKASKNLNLAKNWKLCKNSYYNLNEAEI